MDQQIWYRHFHNPGGWLQSGWRVLPGGFKTKLPVAIAEREGPIAVIAATSETGRIYWAWSANILYSGDWGKVDGSDFASAPKEIPGGGDTFQGPAASGSFDQVQVLVRDTESGIAYQMLKPDFTWKASWSAVPGNGRTLNAPAISSRSTTPNAYVIGTDRKSIWGIGLRSHLSIAPPPLPFTLTDEFHKGWRYVPLSTPRP